MSDGEDRTTPRLDPLRELLARFREKGKRTASGWEAVWAEQDTWDRAADELEDAIAALSTTPAPTTGRSATRWPPTGPVKEVRDPRPYGNDRDDPEW